MEVENHVTRMTVVVLTNVVQEEFVIHTERLGTYVLIIQEFNI